MFDLNIEHWTVQYLSAFKQDRVFNWTVEHWTLNLELTTDHRPLSTVNVRGTLGHGTNSGAAVFSHMWKTLFNRKYRLNIEQISVHLGFNRIECSIEQIEHWTLNIEHWTEPVQCVQLLNEMGYPLRALQARDLSAGSAFIRGRSCPLSRRVLEAGTVGQSDFGF